MLKVASCKLCGMVYRTGQLRQLIEKTIAFDLMDKPKEKSRKVDFVETRILVCKKCYKRIEGKQGIPMRHTSDDLFNLPYEGLTEDREVVEKTPRKRRAKKNEDSGSELDKALGDNEILPIERKDNAEYEAQIAKLKEPNPKPKRGRKKRIPEDAEVLGNLGDASTLEETIPEGTVQNMYMTAGEAPKEPKNRGRKPKATAEALRAKTYHAPEEDVAIQTSIDAQEAVESSLAEMRMPDNNRIDTEAESLTREGLKDRIRQILASSSNILYSEIATRLGIDEDLVGQLADELDQEGNKS